MPLGASKVALFGASADLSSAVLLSTATASDDASLEFTLPTAYKQVKFGFYNVTPASDGVNLTFDCSVSASYGTTKTTSYFTANHDEANTSTQLAYMTAHDLAQSTNAQRLTGGIGNGADESCAGELHLFNPSSAYVKHFYATVPHYESSNYTQTGYVGGYFNTTSALDGCKFLMSSGNISSGVIRMWGIK
jgi:hypothetical protein